MPCKRVMGLNWCPHCWGCELAFWLVRCYCWSWTTCLHSPLSQSCPYTTHPSSSELLSRPFRGCICATLQLCWLLRLSCQENCQSRAQPRLLSPGSILSAMPTAAVHQNCPWDLKEDSPHQQPDFVSDIVSFQQSHILSLREQLLPILATPFRRHTWCSCVVCWEDRTAISKCLWLCSFQLKNT